MPDHRSRIATSLQAFAAAPVRQAALDLLDTLGYRSDKTVALEGSKPKAFLDFIAENNPEAAFDEKKALLPEWKSADLLFQLTDEEISRERSLFQDTTVRAGLLRSYLFFAIELSGGDYARGKLTAIARQINRVFPMPVMVLIKHFTDKTPVLSIAVINRRQNKVRADKDVLGKVTIIRDISLATPHRGHLDILDSFAFDNLIHPQKKPIIDFDALHAAWEEVFNVELLNKRFYKELANWYFWALPQVEFPADLEPDAEKRRATGLIRLLTRLIFCWFLKEKDGLVPEKLFHPADLDKILKGFNPESETSSVYYQAILQNLFFATLNQRMGKDSNGKPYRKFVFDEGYPKNKTNHDLNNYFRYEKYFATSPDDALALFEDIPFLNGGLFECLDKRDEDEKKTFYLDGFSRNAKKRPNVPDRLFFDSGETADLSEVYGDKKRKSENVTGLITILNRYKFTIVENTPIDQEIALDPELLGKVFENLLASYNEETKTTARKQTGSFYTPRPIVEYMVDESLKAHLERKLTTESTENTEKKQRNTSSADSVQSVIKKKLDILFAYTEKEHAFSPTEVATLITAIDEIKILDPACGSGAFPMGALHKLVYILGKLDPDNDQWKQTQLAKLDSAPMREELERAFADNNDDYGRKLYLIENCLYGVDIQPIAIQITKLRFFISLVCDQKTNRDKSKNHGIRPLPNLETKFVAADTLIGLPIPEPDLFIRSVIGPIEKEIEQAYHSHFAIQRRDQKLALQKRIKTLRLKLADAIVNGLGANKNADVIKKAHHVAEWDPFDPQATADFFDPHWMFGRSLADGFDVVIGNPPYVRADEQSDWNQLQRKAILECKQYETLWEKWDLFVPFIERGYKLLRPGGVSAMIVSDAFCHSKYAQKAQNWLLQNARILRLDFCAELKIFDAAVHNVITILQNAPGKTWKPDRRVHKETFGNSTFLPTDEQQNLTYRAFFPEDGQTAVFGKECLPLDQICYVSVGMVVHANEKLDNGAHKGTFELSDVVSDEFDSIHSRRFVEGKHLDRWFIPSCKWLEWNTERAPALFRRPTFPELYEVLDKIFIHRTGGEGLRCAYDPDQTLCNHTVMLCLPWLHLTGVRNNSLKKAARYTGEKPPRPDLPKREELEVTSQRFAVKYLLGVMNSATARDFLRANRRSNTDLYPDDWKKLPIPDVSPEQQKPVIALVDQILTTKRANPAADITPLETQVDTLVAALYGVEEQMACVSPAKPVTKKALPKPDDLKEYLRDICLPDLNARDVYFNVDTLRAYIDGQKVPWSAATLNRYMTELTAGGFVFDAGRGWYSALRQPFVLDTAPVQELIATLGKRFPLLDFSCWSTRQVSSYGHHLLAKFVTFVHTDRDAMESVYEFLRETGFDAHLNPRGDAAKTFLVRDRTVVVRPKVTTQPRERHFVSVEGLLVDLFVESRNLSLMDDAEFFSLFRNLTHEARISMAVLLEYASKRKTAAEPLVESIKREFS
jgi:type I restriction-modification system DNA methylase subunit